MRKYIILPVVLFFFAIAGIVFAHVNIIEQGEQITVTETSLAGDARKASGITMTTNLTYENYMDWILTFSPGETQAVQSTFLYSGLRLKDEPAFDTYTDFSIAISSEGDGITSGVMVDGELHYDGNDWGLPKKALIDIANATPAGKKMEHEILLKDYLKYYPVQLFIPLSENTPELTYLSNKDEMASSYFKIPVLDDAKCTIGVTMDSKKNATDMTFSVDSDLLLEYAVQTDEDTCYVALSGYYSSEKGTRYQVDDEQRGIHILPIKKNGSAASLDMEKAYLAYSLGADEIVLCLIQSIDKNNLLLFTEENDRFYLTVIDKATMKQTQKVFITASDAGFLTVKQEDDFNLIIFDDGTYGFMEQEGNAYISTLSGSLSQLGVVRNNLEILENNLIAADYDGSRLAIAVTGLSDETKKTGYATCLQVFDTSGLLFAGLYQDSITADPLKRGIGASEVSPPISVSWHNAP